MHFCFTKPSVVYDQDKCVLKFDSVVLLGAFVAKTRCVDCPDMNGMGLEYYFGKFHKQNLFYVWPLVVTQHTPSDLRLMGVSRELRLFSSEGRLSLSSRFLLTSEGRLWSSRFNLPLVDSRRGLPGKMFSEIKDDSLCAVWFLLV